MCIRDSSRVIRSSMSLILSCSVIGYLLGRHSRKCAYDGVRWIFFWTGGRALSLVGMNYYIATNKNGLWPCNWGAISNVHDVSGIIGNLAPLRHSPPCTQAEGRLRRLFERGERLGGKRKRGVEDDKYSGNKVLFYFSVLHFSVDRSGQQKNVGQKNVR